MRSRISTVVDGYPASGIRSMFERARRYPDVVSFTFGEPDFDTPDFVKRAAQQALDANHTRYVSNAGLPALRERLAERYAGRWNRPLSPDNLLVTVGAMEALLLALLAVVEPGDEVLVPDPCFPNYLGEVRLVGGRAVPVPYDVATGFRLSAKAVLDRVTDRTAAILLNSPSNPLGRMVELAELRTIVREASRRGVVVISDEVYEEIVFDDHVHTSVGELESGPLNHIVVSSFSKSYAMTGWRCGWLIAHEDLVAKLATVKEGVTSCVAPFVQLAGLAALNGPDEFTQSMRATFQERRDEVVACVEGTDGLVVAPPQGAFYAFIDISGTGLTAQAFADGLLDRQHVCLIPGTAFGAAGAGHVRLSFATGVETIRLGFDRMATFIREQGSPTRDEP